MCYFCDRCNLKIAYFIVKHQFQSEPRHGIEFSRLTRPMIRPAARKPNRRPGGNLLKDVEWNRINVK
jgi:hypothetical protein